FDGRWRYGRLEARVARTRFRCWYRAIACWRRMGNWEDFRAGWIGSESCWHARGGSSFFVKGARGIDISAKRERVGASARGFSFVKSQHVPSTKGKIMKRTASAEWQGDLKQGKGTISTESGVLSKTPYSFSTRFEGVKGTNPEELIAAAHS